MVNVFIFYKSKSIHGYGKISSLSKRIIYVFKEKLQVMDEVSELKRKSGELPI